MVNKIEGGLSPSMAKLQKRRATRLFAIVRENYVINWDMRRAVSNCLELGKFHSVFRVFYYPLKSRPARLLPLPCSVRGAMLPTRTTSLTRHCARWPAELYPCIRLTFTGYNCSCLCVYGF